MGRRKVNSLANASSGLGKIVKRYSIVNINIYILKTFLKTKEQLTILPINSSVF